VSKMVVGVDGSEESKLALRWALDEARLRSTKLVCVHAWTYPTIVDATGLGPPVTLDLHGTLRDDAQSLIDRVLQEVGGVEGIEVEHAVVEDSPANALCAAADETDLLVVGSRGLGGVSSLLLGSVSQQVIHHARCPVVVVPHHRD
jgi:nucleotide-binding universal stress UspA family protein